MGEARQRKLARAAGRPWPQDAPKPPPRVLPYIERYRREPLQRLPIVAVDTGVDDDAAQIERVRALRDAVARSGAEVVVVKADPREGLPVARRPRRSAAELMAIVAALSLDGFPRGRR